MTNDGIEQLKTVGYLRELLAKAHGAYIGQENLSSEVGVSADAVRDQITSNFKDALGSRNRSLAVQAAVALRRLVRDHGEEAEIRNASQKAISDSQKASDRLIASMNQVFLAPPGA